MFEQAFRNIDASFNARQRAFLDFVLQHYVSVGVEELDQDKLTPLLRLKYHNSLADAVADLGAPDEIGQVFAGFQKFLYAPRASAVQSAVRAERSVLRAPKGGVRETRDRYRCFLPRQVRIEVRNRAQVSAEWAASRTDVQLL